jgi:guanylate kinase
MSNIFIISAPSGCGKTSLVKELCHANTSVEQTISYTTRKKRQGEKNIKDYHFVSTDDFLNKIKLGHFIEYQAVYSNYYGTTYESIKEINDTGKDAILEIDYKGMLSIKRALPNAISIYILPPNIRELEKRLVNRGLDEKEVIRRRISEASHELKFSKFSDFTIINDEFNKALSSLKALILLNKIQKHKEIEKLNMQS